MPCMRFDAHFEVLECWREETSRFYPSLAASRGILCYLCIALIPLPFAHLTPRSQRASKHAGRGIAAARCLGCTGGSKQGPHDGDSPCGAVQALHRHPPGWRRRRGLGGTAATATAAALCFEAEAGRAGISNAPCLTFAGLGEADCGLHAAGPAEVRRSVAHSAPAAHRGSHHSGGAD